MEHIINLVSKLRKVSNVQDRISKIVSKYAYAYNSKETRRAIASEITSELNNLVEVTDCTFSHEADEGAMTFLVLNKLGHKANLVTVYHSGNISTQKFEELN